LFICVNLRAIPDFVLLHCNSSKPLIFAKILTTDFTDFTDESPEVRNFQAGSTPLLQAGLETRGGGADLEIGGTADLEICATRRSSSTQVESAPCGGGVRQNCSYTW
jgi:hypothetical protein